MLETIPKSRPIADRMMACFRMVDLYPREQIVIAIIAYHDGPRGAWPSLATIAREAGIARSTVADVIKSLRRKRRILVTHGRHTNRYTVVYDRTGAVSVRENQTVRNNGQCQEDPNSQCQGDPNQNLNGTKAPPEERLMRSGSKGHLIGFCVECGFDRHSGQEACCACGSEARPFFVLEHELKSGVLTLPFGLCVSGLDTMEGRKLFMSDEGQAGLRDAYRQIFECASAECNRQH